MPYLICEECGNYYELEEGESPEDFQLECGCGGELGYYSTKYDYYKNHRSNHDSQIASEKESPEHKESRNKGFFSNLDAQSKGFIAVGVFGVFFLILLFSLPGIFSSMSPSYRDMMPPEVQAAHAPILVVLYAPRCSACRQFESETLNNPDVQQKLSTYSVMKINVDTSPEQASRFNSNVIPTMVLLDANGKEIRRNVGYMTASDFINFLKT
nr:thioredoxin fold domain-containing protein [uncultured Methanobacterium sp.]